MEQAFTQFMNETKWTNDEFRQEERIECNIQINVEEVNSTGNFRARTQIQAARPVYGTGYNSITFNFPDTQFNFEFNGQPLIYTDNSYNDNITALLSFYAFLILGMDYDSFSELGGSPYYQKAFSITQVVPQGGAGWQQFDSNARSRFSLLDDILNPSMEEFRIAMYQYHRQGLDKFASEQEEAREVIFEAIKLVKNANDARPQSNIISTFFDSKADELVNIFSQGDMSMRREVYNLLTNMKPSDREKFQAIIR